VNIVRDIWVLVAKAWTRADHKSTYSDIDEKIDAIVSDSLYDLDRLDTRKQIPKAADVIFSDGCDEDF
jgi:hypothetical protein